MFCLQWSCKLQAVTISNAVTWYEKSDNASSQSECKSKADVKMVILNDIDQLRPSIEHTL